MENVYKQGCGNANQGAEVRPDLRSAPRKEGCRKRGYIIMPPFDHAPSGSGLTSPDGGAEPSAPLSDVAEDPAVGGASRCAVDPGTSSSWTRRHSAPPSERTVQPDMSATIVCSDQSGWERGGDEEERHSRCRLSASIRAKFFLQPSHG